MKDRIMVSCGGVVICRGKVLALYYKNKFGTGWVLPKGKVEAKETHKEAALREVHEESGAKAKILKPLGKTNYSFLRNELAFNKTVHWFLMSADSFYCNPQAEEHFMDGGYYKKHEAFYLLKYEDERELLCRAFNEYSKILHFKNINNNERSLHQ